MLLGNVLGLVLGAGRDIVLAARFGATEQTDAYFLAFTVPNLVWLSMLSALMASFIPSYSDVEARQGRDGADRFARGVGRVLIALFLPISLLYALGLPWLLDAIGRGAPDSVVDRGVELGYLMAPIVVISVVSSLLASLLYLHDHFALPALGQGLISGIVIAAVFLLRPLGIEAVAVGTLIGFVLKLSLEYFVLCRLNPSYRRPWTAVAGPFGPDVWPALRLLVLALVGFNLIGQGTQLLERTYASHLETGAITALQYATKLGWVPLQFASAIAVALLPALARHAVTTDELASPRQLTTGVAVVTIVTFPAAFALLILADPLTTLVYERQAFGEAEALLTVEALQGYAWGLPAVAASLVLWNVLYAWRDMKTPILISSVALAGYALLNGPLGLGDRVFGVALANALTSILMLGGILIALRVKGGSAALEPIARRLGAVTVAALVTLALPAAIGRLAIERGTGDLDSVVSRVALVAVAALLYAATIWRTALDDGVILRTVRRYAGRLIGA